MLWRPEGNIRDCLIFDNTLISNDAYSSISENIFSNGTWDRYRNEIKSLKLKNCLGDNSNILPFESFNQRNNIGLRFMEYFRVAGVLRATRAKFEENLLKLSKPIQIFFEEIKMCPANIGIYLKLIITIHY